MTMVWRNAKSYIEHDFNIWNTTGLWQSLYLQLALLDSLRIWGLTHFTRWHLKNFIYACMGGEISILRNIDICVCIFYGSLYCLRVCTASTISAAQQWEELLPQNVNQCGCWRIKKNIRHVRTSKEEEGKISEWQHKKRNKNHLSETILWPAKE